MKSYWKQVGTGVADNLTSLLTVLAAFGAGAAVAVFINSQITDSVTQVHDQITDSVTVLNPNIERSNLINGEIPPMTPSKSMFETRLLTENYANGWQVITSRTVRQAGTRSPIHVHPYGGQTCVLSGEMTLYMDGSEPLVAGPGECYWMPPGRRMTGVNSAESATLMLDTFFVPKGEGVWIVVEPGMEDSQGQFDDHSH
jgi:quercetin dioxygenase-like cupin family protein